MPTVATDPAGIVAAVLLSSTVKPAGTLLKLRLNVSAAGPVFWMDARNADCSCAPFTGTENWLSAVTFKFTPGVVALNVIITGACAARFGSLCEIAVTHTGKVPLCNPAAGVTVTLPLVSMKTDQPGGASALIRYVSVSEVARVVANVTGAFWFVVSDAGLGVTARTCNAVPLMFTLSVVPFPVTASVPLKLSSEIPFAGLS